MPPRGMGMPRPGGGRPPPSGGSSSSGGGAKVSRAKSKSNLEGFLRVEELCKLFGVEQQQ